MTWVQFYSDWRYRILNVTMDSVCKTKSLALFKISYGSSVRQDSISYMQKYARIIIMNFKSLIFMNRWCRAKSTVQSTQTVFSVFVIFGKNFISGCVSRVLLFEWRGQRFFPTGNSHTCPGVGDSHGPNKLPGAHGGPFKLISHFWWCLWPYFIFRIMTNLRSHKITTVLLRLSIWCPKNSLLFVYSHRLLSLYKLAFHRGRGFPFSASWSASSSGARGLCCLPPPETYARRSITSSAEQAADEKKSSLYKNRQYPKWTHTLLLSY